MPATTTTVSAPKPEPESKVGIAFKSQFGRIIVTRLTDKSIFLGTVLEDSSKKWEICSINDIAVLGKSTEEVKELLGSIVGDVSLTLQPAPTTCLLEFNINPKTPDIQFERPTSIPPELAAKNVTTDEWEAIVDAFAGELLPAASKWVTNDDKFQQRMKSYKKYVHNSLHDCHVEQELFALTSRHAMLFTTLGLHGTNVVSHANAILNPKGVVAKLDFTERAALHREEYPKIVSIPTALHFVIL